MRSPGESAASALLAVLHAHPTTRLADVDENALLDLIDAHRIAGLFEERIAGIEHSLSAEALERIATLRKQAWVRNVVALRKAQRVRQLLDPVVGPNWLIVKGPALADWYGSSNSRAYGDLDLLVNREHFEPAMAALEAGGFPPLTANWDGFRQYGVAEVPMGTHDMAIDLHWHLIALADVRREFDVEIKPMVARRAFFGDGAESLPTLDPEDTLLHLCVHGGLGGARRLLWLLDIDAVLRTGRVDWPTFRERAHRARSAMMCATMLDRCRQVLGSDVPTAVIDDLDVVPGLVRLNRVVAGIPRSDTKRCSSWSHGFVQSATRDSLADTLSELRKAASTQVDLVRGRPRIADTGGAIDWRGPDSGPEGKRRWLDYVASDNI